MKTANGDKDRVLVTVRIPGHILQKIDSRVDQEEVPVSRNHWIVEALMEKLKKNEAGNGSNGSQ
jgi:metal-responsive CopG/Arc/MetJ family transcriptional regulator